jgi:formylglycine-generating enzyme required for sulfatase activity
VDGATYVLVPAGDFSMGSADGNPDEQPVHTVTLDEFWIKQTEVTNDEYRRCVDAGACTAPRSAHWNDPAFAAHPVVGIAWEDAQNYAGWAGGRLPTEAEWEKAAHGTEAIAYPWGNELPVPELLNYDNAVGDTLPVGSYPTGASPYGALDMAGNVEEWVADVYEGDYYGKSPAEDPPGPQSGILRVLRGGSYESGRADVRTTFRGRTLPDARYPSVGFRVLMTAP